MIKEWVRSLLHASFLKVYGEFRTVWSAPAYPCVVNLDYDDYWKFREHFYDNQPRFPLMADNIEPNDRVLDVGCGDGGCLWYIKQRKQIWELGIDVSRIAVEKARMHGIDATVSDLVTLSRNNEPRSFDVVIVSEVIEHIVQAEEFLTTAWGLAKKTLIVTFPNIAYWPYRLQLLFGKAPVQWVLHPAEHVRFWSIGDFVRWIHALQLPDANIQSVKPSNGLEFMSLHRVWPNLFGHQIVVILHREPGTIHTP